MLKKENVWTWLVDTTLSRTHAMRPIWLDRTHGRQLRASCHPTLQWASTPPFLFSSLSHPVKYLSCCCSSTSPSPPLLIHLFFCRESEFLFQFNRVAISYYKILNKIRSSMQPTCIVSSCPYIIHRTMSYPSYPILRSSNLILFELSLFHRMFDFSLIPFLLHRSNKHRGGAAKSWPRDVPWPLQATSRQVQADTKAGFEHCSRWPLHPMCFLVGKARGSFRCIYFGPCALIGAGSRLGSEAIFSSVCTFWCWVTGWTQWPLLFVLFDIFRS